MVALLVLFVTGLLLFRSFLVEEKVEEVVLEKLESLFGKSINISSISSSDVLRQVELRSIELNAIPGSPVSSGYIDRVVIGLGSSGIRSISVQGANLELTRGNHPSSPGGSQYGLASLLGGVKTRQLRRFPLIYLENCHVLLRNATPGKQYPDICVEDVSGRITARDRFLIAHLEGRDGLEKTGSGTATVTVDCKYKTAEINLDVKNSQLGRYGRYLKYAPYISYDEGTFDLQGTIGWRPGNWESTGIVFIKDGAMHLAGAGRIAHLCGPVLFENWKHRIRKLDGLSFDLNGVTFCIAKGIEIDRQVEMQLVPGRKFATKLKEEAENHGLKLRITDPLKTHLHLSGKMPDVIITGETHMAGLTIHEHVFRDVSLSYSLQNSRFQINNASAGYLGGTLAVSGNVELTGKRPFSLDIETQYIDVSKLACALIPQDLTTVSSAITVSGHLQTPDSVSCRGDIRAENGPKFSFNGKIDIKEQTIRSGSRCSFTNIKPGLMMASRSAPVCAPATPVYTSLTEALWSGKGRLDGPFSHPVFQGEVTSKAVPIGELGSVDIRAWLITSEEKGSHLRKLALSVPGVGEVLFNGDISEKRCSGSVQGEKLEIDFIPGLEAKADITAEITGSPGNPVISGKVFCSDVTVHGVSLGSVDLTIEGDSSSVKLGIGETELNCLLPDNDGGLAFKQISGTIRGTIESDVTGGVVNYLAADLEMVACDIAGVKVDTIECKSRYANGVWIFDRARASVGLGTIDLSGFIRHSGDLGIKLDLDSVAAESVKNLILPDDEVNGALDATLLIKGTTTSPEVSVAVEVDGLAVADVFAADKMLMIAFIRNETLYIERSFIRFGDRNIRFSGSYPIGKGRGDVNLRVHMESGTLSFVSALFPYLENVDGTGGIDIAMTGPVGNPVFNGLIDIRNLSMQVKGWKFPLKGFELAVSIVDNMVDVRGSLSPSNPLPLTIKGELNLHDLLSPLMRLELTVGESHIKLSDLFPGDMRLPVSLDGKAGAHLVFTGKPGDLNLSGDVRFSEGRVGISFGSDVRLLQLPCPWLNVDVDVVIGEQVSVQGNLYSLEVEGNLDAEGRNGFLFLNGRLNVRRGEIAYLNNDFEVLSGDIRLVSLQEQQCEIAIPASREFKLPSFGVLASDSDTTFRYNGKPHVLRAQHYNEEEHNKCLNYEVDLQAQTQLHGVTVTMQVAGRGKDFTTTFYSNPQMPEEKILTMLSSEGGGQGGTDENWTRSEPGLIKFVETGLKSSLWSEFGNSIAQSLDLDQFKISTSSENAGFLGDPSIQLGKYLDDDLYVTYEHSFTLTGGRSLALEYRVEKRLTLDTAILNYPYEDDLRFGVKFSRFF